MGSAADSWYRIRPRLGSDITVGLVGFPNSGKTSYLYALKSLPRSAVRVSSPWVIGGGSPDAGRLTGDTGQAQSATKSGHLRFARFCKVKRLLLGIPAIGAALGRTRWLTTAEVSGETLQAIARGDDDPSRVDNSEEYLAFLSHSTLMMVFVSMDGARARRGIGDVTDPDSVLLEGLKSIERVLVAVAERRSGSGQPFPMVISLLLTKIDLIFDVPELATVQLPASRSAVQEVARRRGESALLDWLEQRGTDAGWVTFPLQGILAHASVGQDLELQQAVAADFVKCHAPKSALQLAAMQGDQVYGANLRFFLCAPYGSAFSDDRGGDRFPRPDEIRPIMVHEPLVDALERAWQYRARARHQRQAIWAVSLLAALVLLFPGLRWVLGSHLDRALDAAPESRTWNDISYRLAMLNWCPEIVLHRYVPAIRWVSPRVARQHASRVFRCSAFAPEPLDVELARQARQLSPDDPSIQDQLGAMYVERVVQYLDGTLGIDAPIRVEVGDGAVDQLLQELQKREANPSDVSAGGNETRLLERLERLRAMVSFGAGGSDSWIAAGSNEWTLRDAIDRCVEARFGRVPASAGSAGRPGAARLMDSAMRRGDFESARIECDKIAAACEATWKPLQSPADLSSWSAAPAWLEAVRGARVSRAIQDLEARRVEAVRGWMAQTRNVATMGVARAREECGKCVMWVRDLEWSYEHPDRGNVPRALADQSRVQGRVAILRQDVLEGLQSLNPWPKEWIEQVAVSYGRVGTDPAGELKPLLDAQRSVLKESLDSAQRHAEARGDTQRAADVLRVREQLGLVHPVEASGKSIRFRAMEIASTQPLDVESLKRVVGEYVRSGAGPEDRASLSRDIIASLSNACCMPGRSQHDDLLAALRSLGLSRADIARGLLEPMQRCFCAKSGWSAESIAEQARRVRQLLDESGVDWRTGLRPTFDAVLAEFVRARSADDLGPGSALHGLLTYLEQVGVTDSGAKRLLAACQRHIDRVREWDLLKVRTGEGGSPAPFWLARHEWTRDGEVARLLSVASRAEIDELSAAIAPARIQMPERRISFDEMPTRSLLQSNLGIETVGGAKALVALAGLRLPTGTELSAAQARGGSWKESRRPVLYARREEFMEPSDFGKEDVSADDIVGLNIGAREWTASGLWGLTHCMPSNAPLDQDGAIRPYVLGVRPALDAYPPELRSVLGR